MFAKLSAFTALLPFLTSAVLAAPAPQAAAEEYDYIVVGSGPGGGPLAVSLAKANYSVLLLEAGDDSLQGGGQYPPTITWDFFVKHYEEEERILQNHRLTWRLPDGQYWVGPASRRRGAARRVLPSRRNLRRVYHDQRHVHIPAPGQ